MDRKITLQKHAKIAIFKEFEYLDLFPYSIALFMLGGTIYILNAFVTITYSMH